MPNMKTVMAMALMMYIAFMLLLTRRLVLFLFKKYMVLSYDSKA